MKCWILFMTTCCLLGTSSLAFLTSNHMKPVVINNHKQFEVNNYQVLHMVKPVASLKPAATPLMNSGKAIARTGELIIELTSALDLYGGGLSAAGANIRNAGDHIAQAAASCRFKTGAELVCDEMREGATCFLEASQDFLKKAVDEAETDKDMNLKKSIEEAIPHLEMAGITLEAAGAGILQRASIADIGSKLVESGTNLELFGKALLKLAEDKEEAKIASQRMLFGSQQMIEAGNELTGEDSTKAKKNLGKGWIKG